MRKEVYCCVILIFALQFVVANNVFVSPASVPTTQGSIVSLQVRVNTTTSDIHSIQFDLTYNPLILSFSSLTEGSFLSTGGKTTIFNRTSISSGLIYNIYNVRNTTYTDSNPGISGTNGVIAIINFTAIAGGTSNIGISNALWVNSSILNASAAVVTPTISNGSVTVTGSSSCTLTSAVWSTISATEGQPVTLTLTGTNCDGKQMNFTVWEDDSSIFEFPLGGADDPANINPVNAVFSGGTATTTWTSEWQNDCGGLCNPPEYYFVAYQVDNPSNTITSSKSQELVTNKLYNANEIYVSPASQIVNQGNSFLVQVKGRAPVTASDVYGVQYNITYDPTILSVNSVSEGTMLNSDSAVTIFNYTLSSGVIKTYDIRNVTYTSLNPGIYTDDGVFLIVNFSAISSGTSNLNIGNLIWVNSTITNQSVGIPGVTITNGNVNVNGPSVDNFPTINLNSPADGSQSNLVLVNFNGLVSDDKRIMNVSLYINNTFDQINISGMNTVNYIFAKTFVNNGTYSWYYKACDNASQCTNSATRILTINTTVLDTTPPGRSNGQPTGSLLNGTTQVYINLTTNETANCRYSTTPGIVYSSIVNNFSTTGGIFHNQLITGLTNGNSYSYYVRCQDLSLNANPDDFVISFSVLSSSSGGDLIIFNDAYGSPTAYSNEFSITAGNTYAGVNKLEAASGSWNRRIENINIPLTNITDWSKANLTLAIRTTAATPVIEVSLFNTADDVLGQHMIATSTSSANYEVKTIPLTSFASDKTAFGGTQIVEIMFGAAWPAPAVYFDEIKIVQGGVASVCTDLDGDGYGNPGDVSCPNGAQVDCNDNNASIHPGATEICNSADDNCNEQTDEGVTTTFYRDLDADTFGNLTNTIAACSQPVGYVGNSLDCNDNNLNVHPGATEVCNGVDDNCNGQVDEGGNLLCNDSLVCNGAETCAGLSGCQPGIPINCAGNNLSGIANCNNNPDNVPFTWDFRSSFTSTCIEPGACTNGNPTITHVCNISSCGAQCENNGNCANTCNGAIRQYSGTCNATCGCNYVSENCGALSGWYNTTNLTLVSTGQCTQKQQLQQAYRTYSCTPGACTYSNTSWQWIDTGLTGNKVDGTVCNDTLWCTVGDVCTTGVCGGAPRNCNDGFACTQGDSCSEALQSCTYVANNSVCSDGLFCNGNETCAIGVGCQPGIPPFVNDGFSCTIDSCNELTDQIVHSPDNSVCQNGLWCDGSEVCNPSLFPAPTGCGIGNPQSCGDSVPCTTDTCSEGVNVTDNLGSCVHDTSSCSCTTPGPAPVQCNDNNPCTDDVCSASLTCQNVPNDVNTCNDGLFCTVNDRCSAGSCISDPINVSDNIGCTSDSCNETSDQILHLPNDAVCNDGLWCNGLDSCNALLGCQAGTPVNCADSFSCTNDFCNETSDSCNIHLNDNTKCFPGQVCNPLQFNPPTGCGTVVTCTDLDGDGYGNPGDASCLNGAQTDCNDTNFNVHPGAVEVCGNGIDEDCNGSDLACPPGNCVITNLYWSTTNVTEGTPVNLIVEGSNCQGKQVNFTIWEDDGFADELVGDDPVVLEPVSVTFGNTNATGLWISEWQDDGFLGIGGDPEYYFVANVSGGVSGASLKTQELKVHLLQRKWEVKTIHLNVGKNSLSLPLILHNMSVADVFKGISSSTDKIYTYDGGFEIYYFDGRPSNLANLEIGKGYFVFMKNAADLIINGTTRNELLERPVIQLNPGWNLIGTFSNAYEASVIFQNVNYDQLYTYNEATGNYDSVASTGILDGEKSYWIYVTQASTFTPVTGIVIGNA
jgi:hypothetical protein